MKTKRLAVIIGMFGAAFGMGLDGYISSVKGWGYDPLQNVLAALFCAALFGWAAHSALKPAKNEGRVEQVVGIQLSAEDCYESIVIEQKEF